MKSTNKCVIISSHPLLQLLSPFLFGFWLIVTPGSNLTRMRALPTWKIHRIRLRRVGPRLFLIYSFGEKGHGGAVIWWESLCHTPLWMVLYFLWLFLLFFNICIFFSSNEFTFDNKVIFVLINQFLVNNFSVLSLHN